jgi:hypothetical protein
MLTPTELAAMLAEAAVIKKHWCQLDDAFKLAADVEKLVDEVKRQAQEIAELKTVGRAFTPGFCEADDKTKTLP